MQCNKTTCTRYVIVHSHNPIVIPKNARTDNKS